ncbi:MAG: alpha/beta hydrolase-fold protein [Bacteroidales bacterium]|jgi:predicted alpha/beta superfamily hydrolase|nr:alpha/beta hydrolase-fold protein [Bacteroidales bacterium]MDG2080669.1 alpha/beta hydrolase-fold protein [Bacteroidales bacterium]|tara:strand:- start:1388 stop:2317 length:930 start_codon:yes stop_codon:yes gene_type:complete
MRSLVLLIVTGLLFYSCNSNISKVNTGEIIRLDSFPSKFVSPRNIDIWIPSNYSSDSLYAVMYMHDGQMLYDSSKTWNKQEWGVDEVISNLQKDKLIRNCIVVGIWNSGPGRHSDYFPQKPFEHLDRRLQDSLLNKLNRNGSEGLFYNGIQSDNYLKFLVEELKPYVDKNFQTKPDLDNTFVCGSSMGGLISMYAICEYPNVFGGAACLSTHWIGTFSADNNPIPESFAIYLSNNLPDSNNHKIYFDYGTETLDALYEPFQLKVDSVLKSAGYDQNNWLTLRFDGHDHSENSWRKRLDIPFEFLLRINN